MHGTFLNKQKVSRVTPTPIRAGDELVLGMPVFRLQEEYTPALLRIYGVDFQETQVNMFHTLEMQPG